MKCFSKPLTALLAAAIFSSAIFAAENFEWKSASPKSLGLDEKKIQAFLAELPDTLVTSCVIVKDGTIASIDCAVGDACAAGQLLATLN